MKKKLFIGTILPSIAALAVIGSGFSLWIFDDSNSISTSGSVGINVTKVLDITNSTITIVNKEGSYLIFDQSSTGADGMNPKGEGLIWSDVTGISNQTQMAVFQLADPATDNAVAYDDSVNYTFTTTITLKKVLASYVELSFENDKNKYFAWDDEGTLNSETNATGDVTYTYIYTLKPTSKDDLSFVQFFDFNNLVPNYVSGKEPTTLGKSDEDEGSYLKMLKDVKGQTISVTYEVKASIVSE